VLHAVKKSDVNVLFTYANADDGGRLINQTIEQFVLENKEKYHIVKSLGQLKYLSALKHVDLLIGNASSGIVEAASFYKPVVNIGDRQKGRLQSGNVIDCSINAISNAIDKALSNGFKEKCSNVINIYGEGKSAASIVNILEESKLSVIKRFVDNKTL